jgi:LDH2 family malate/lactate/ureidoglycolate dehydrogenase
VGTVLVTTDEERTLLLDVLRGLGAAPDEANIVARVLLEADLRGQNSHGILRLPTIAARVHAGLIRPGVSPAVTWRSLALGQMDARHGFGHIMADRAIRLAMDRARRTGIAAVAVRNNNHIGMIGYYAELAAEAGVVAIVMTTSEALVTPHDGAEAMVGTNPIAVGFPSHPRPFVLDMATSATAKGKIIDRYQRDEPIPEGWAVGSDGRVTTDAAAALAGAIMPFGGAKGFGLGLAVELLAGALIGAATGSAVRGTLDAEFPATKGDLFLAIDPSPLAGADTLPARAGHYLASIRASRPAEGTSGPRIPGDRARDCRAERLVRGIPLSEEAWEAALALRPARLEVMVARQAASA